MKSKQESFSYDLTAAKRAAGKATSEGSTPKDQVKGLLELSREDFRQALIGILSGEVR